VCSSDLLGMLLAAGAMAWLAQLTPSSSYAGHVVPALIVLGVGFGNIIAPAIASVTYGVATHDTGVASATANTMQQIGGSVGTALLSTLAVSATTDFIAENGPRFAAQAAVEGYTTAFWWSAAIFAVGAIVTGSLLRSGVRPEMAHGPAPEAVAA